MVTIGQLAGAFIAMYLFSKLFEWAIFKRVFDDAVKGKVGSVLAALALAEGAYAFSSMGTSTYAFGAISYFVAALVFAVRGYIRGTDINIESQYGESDEALEETFR